MSYYNIFLDDERSPKDVTWIQLPLVNWEIVRNYFQFTSLITSKGLPQNITFDHDLSDEHYKEYFRSNKNNSMFNYRNMTEKTGRDCALWLANYCIDRCLPLPVYYVHSMNGPGSGNIISILESARKAINERQSMVT